MRLVRELQPLMDTITQIRSSGAAFTSNLFAGPSQLQEWIDAGELRSAEGRGAILLFQQDRVFHRLYHVAADPEALSANLAAFTLSAIAPVPLVSDLVGQGKNICDIAGCYTGHGFSEYGRLLRMARPAVASHDSSPDSGVVTATVKDVPAIRQFLEERLDPLVDRIPTSRSLETAAGRGGILVVWGNRVPAGVLIFEGSSYSAALRYWYVAPGFQGKGIGSRLINAFFRECPGARRIVVWVAAGNSESIAKYRHFGFSPDGLEDRIMLRNHDARSIGAGNN